MLSVRYGHVQSRGYVDQVRCGPSGQKIFKEAPVSVGWETLSSDLDVPYNCGPEDIVGRYRRMLPPSAPSRYFAKNQARFDGRQGCGIAFITSRQGLV